MFQGSALLSNGELVIESRQRVLERANGITRWLQSADLPDRVIATINIADEPNLANGIDDYKNRRVVIHVSPQIIDL